jgi:hypothetical protein
MTNEEIRALLDKLRLANSDRTLYVELGNRMAEQDAQWGGPEHDDTHTQIEWCRFINNHTWRAYHNPPMHDEIDLPPLRFEDKMLDVAALAIQAIKSSRRKRAANEEQGESPILSPADARPDADQVTEANRQKLERDR